MTKYSSLRVRLAGIVFIAITPASILSYYLHRSWMGLGVGLIAMAVSWFVAEYLVLRHIRVLLKATERLEMGDYSARTGLRHHGGELSELAERIDAMAEKLEQRSKEHEQVEKALLARSLQQTTISALGQFALISMDYGALIQQALVFVGQTLETEFCHVLELTPDRQSLLMRAGTGWKPGFAGKLVVPVDPKTQCGYTLQAGEPVVVENVQTERRFRPAEFLVEHGVVSGVTVAILGQGRPHGILGVHTAKQRRFNEDEVHFLLGVATVVAMAVDRVQVEAQLEKLAAFAQLNPNPAMEVTAQGEVTYSNEAAMKLTGVLGKESPAEILPAEAVEIVGECLSSGQVKQGLNTKVEGHTLSWAFHPVAASQVVHAYVEDITQRLSLEEQLWQSQKMESVGQLAAGVAHDFNNMLTVIHGHTGMMLDKPELAQELRASAQAITFAAERATNLTRQLLMFSRKTVLQRKPLNLAEAVANLSRMLERLIGETIKLQVEREPGKPLVEADLGMIEQVIMNLAVNARDAMPKGGRLTISTGSVQVTDDYVKLHPTARAGSFVRMRVRDTGTGMSPETMKRIFEPFFTTKAVGKGTGLGLATVYGIVKQHEGWIEVDSELGRGTTFSIYIPASEVAVEASAARAAEDELRGGQERILIVEDEPVLRELANVILTNAGYDTLQAGSGPEALAIWEQHHDTIDLLLTDMIMPEGMSGMELAQKLRAMKPSLKVILASGYGLEDTDSGAMRKGCDALLQKPYTHASLMRVVRTCLDRVPAVS